MPKSYQVLEDFLKELNIKYYANYPFSKCSGFKVGGVVGLYIVAESEDKFFNLMKYLLENNIEYFITGDGNNILVCDEGYGGIIISMGGDFTNFVFDNNYLYASSAAKLERLSHEARIKNLAGLEFVALLNSTIGSAVHENLIAFGKSIMDHVVSVRVMDLKGRVPIIQEYKKEEYITLDKFALKTIRILSVTFALEEDTPLAIDNRIDWYKYIRGSVTPIEANIGPVFEDIDSLKAHEMVERVGGLDMKFGFIQWHRRFPNYIINTSDFNEEDTLARVSDVILLIEETKKKIEQHYAVSPKINITILKNI